MINKYDNLHDINLFFFKILRYLTSHLILVVVLAVGKRKDVG